MVIKSLPDAPGIYLFKDKWGRVIYIGKAKSIKRRVNSYFQKRPDWKTASLLQEYKSVDYVATSCEMEALLLEARLIRDYQPKFNVLLKDGQPFVYILFTQEDLPRVEVVRNKQKTGVYFGPFLQKIQARKVLEYLIRTFQLRLCNKNIENGCLDYHLGLCAGSCKVDFDIDDYKFRLQLAQDALKNKHKKLLTSLKEKIAIHSQNLAFEKAKHLQEYVDNLDTILSTIRMRFSESAFSDAVLYVTAPAKQFDKNIDIQLQQFLQLDFPVRSVDCFDISHFQSSYIVGSCVRFTNGVVDKHGFRKFKIKGLKEQNDYAALQEIVSRRYAKEGDYPDLIVIDGGKGQLSAVERIVPDIACISLAKREETIFSKQFLPDGKKLNLQDDIGKLLIALRDYAHHFAISYHRKKRHSTLSP